VSSGPVTLSQLCEMVLLSPSTVNGIIDRLEVKGLVVRQRTDPDRRKVLHSATPAGRQLAVRVPSLLQDKLMESVRRLPPREQQSLLAALETVAILMESEDTGA
jgi:DNA-binding MarR family transcriptional regulator